MRRFALIAALAVATTACDELTGPTGASAIELTYSYRNNVEGLCYVTPSITIHADGVELGDVQLAEYGKIIYTAPAEYYWNGSVGQTMRVYAAGSAMIWQRYLFNGKKYVKSLSLRCN